MSAPSTPVHQIIRARRVSTPPPIPRRQNATLGVSPEEAEELDAILRRNIVPILSTPPRMVCPSGGSPTSLPALSLPAPASSPVTANSRFGRALSHLRLRVRTFADASISWSDDNETEEEDGHLMDPPPHKRFRSD